MPERGRFNREYIPLKAGQTVEEEVLGKVKNSVEWEDWNESGLRLPVQKAFEDVRDRQPLSPTMPPTPFTSALRRDLISKLTSGEYVDPKIIKYVKYYTGVGSDLDYEHGTDAFIQIEHENEEDRIITLDIKTNPNQPGTADIIFLFPPDGLDPEIDKEQYYGTMLRVSEGLIDKYANPSKYINTIDYVTKEELDDL